MSQETIAGARWSNVRQGAPHWMYRDETRVFAVVYYEAGAYHLEKWSKEGIPCVETRHLTFSETVSLAEAHGNSFPTESAAPCR
jgi:hypothetical protein